MRIFAEAARLPDAWAADVLIEIDARGRIAAVERDRAAVPADAQRVAGPLIPGIPNLHSHAFQRVFAGRTERRASAADSFWTWREAMYGWVERLDPDQLFAVTRWAYVEMLLAGYTRVGEFHYLHHAPGGTPYDDRCELSERVVQAAKEAGLDLTLLPVLYAHGGFGARPLQPAQRRFANDLEGYASLFDALHTRHGADERVRLGFAAHSLRAVTPAQLEEALSLVHRLAPEAPVHLHIAEQTREVEECVAWSGERPVRWLLDHAPVDDRWCLVHATHIDDGECAALADSGAVAGLCPTTEANLGDGLFPAPGYLTAGGEFGIGSDSQVSISPPEELRLLEYGQRLRLRRRAVLAAHAGESVGASLYVRAAGGGARALGIEAGRIAPGQRADLVVLDGRSPLLGAPVDDRILDTLVFAGDRSLVRDVMVGGTWRVRDHHHPLEERAASAFRDVLRTTGR